MELQLNDNIRRMRKERNLTQEQLAEALGVTTGAVYKWEAGLSVPELGMLVQLANFFDMSVDALIGYEIKDNRREATLERLRAYRNAKDEQGIQEAERAAMRYPNCFDVIYRAAQSLQLFALEHPDKVLAERALTLYEKSLLLLEQNTDPEISELTIRVAIAECEQMLGQKEKALKTLKDNNPMGVNNAMIGMWAITHCNDEKESEEYLSRALLENATRLFVTTMGYLNLYEKQKRWDEMRALLEWSFQMNEGLTRENENSPMVKSCAILQGCLAMMEYWAGDEAAARRTFRAAKVWAARFDAAPDYHVSKVPFVKLNSQAISYDDMGATGMDAIERLVRVQEDERLMTLWWEVRDEEA